MANREIEINFCDPSPEPACLGDERPDGSYVSCVRVSEFLSFVKCNDGLYKDQFGDYLIDPEELVITHDKISIKFDYPLKNPAVVEFEKQGGWTRHNLFGAIFEGYRKIYGLEEAKAGDPGLIPGMLNRMPSNGPFGIWGHVLEDLYLECVIIDDDPKTPIKLGVGS